MLDALLSGTVRVDAASSPELLELRGGDHGGFGTQHEAFAATLHEVISRS
jgi:hypothetical protein